MMIIMALVMGRMMMVMKAEEQLPEVERLAQLLLLMRPAAASGPTPYFSDCVPSDAYLLGRREDRIRIARCRLVDKSCGRSVDGH